MFTNELKKGDRVRLSNGWYATIMDNSRGNSRMCMVEGIEKELGAVYSHDMVALVETKGQSTHVVLVHTPAQLKLKKLVTEMFGG